MKIKATSYSYIHWTLTVCCKNGCRERLRIMWIATWRNKSDNKHFEILVLCRQRYGFDRSIQWFKDFHFYIANFEEKFNKLQKLGEGFSSRLLASFLSLLLLLVFLGPVEVCFGSITLSLFWIWPHLGVFCSFWSLQA